MKVPEYSDRTSTAGPHAGEDVDDLIFSAQSDQTVSDR